MTTKTVIYRPDPDGKIRPWVSENLIKEIQRSESKETKQKPA